MVSYVHEKSNLTKHPILESLKLKITQYFLSIKDMKLRL